MKVSVNEKKGTLAGVMGWPIGHSLSPRLHGYWLRKHGISGNYEHLAVKPEILADSLRSLSLKGFSGVNLTIPHKEAALSLMDHLDPLAQRVGAVNTVVFRRDGSLEGRNTDVFGFAENLRVAGFKPTDKPVTLLGAGGAARAAIVALADWGCPSIRIVNRTVARAEKLAQEFTTSASRLEAFALDDWEKALKNACLLVNATSLGLTEKGTMDFEALSPEAWVTDMVYTPPLTAFLKQAQARGNAIVDGLGMLLYQAVPAFEAFFGVRPEVTKDTRQYVVEGM